MKNALYFLMFTLLLFSIGCEEKGTSQEDSGLSQQDNTSDVKQPSEGEVVEYSGILKTSTLGDYRYCIDNFENRQIRPTAVFFKGNSKPGQDVLGKRVSVKGLLLKTTIGSNAPESQIPLQPLFYMEEYEISVIE